MFLRLVADSFTRRPRRKLLTGAALALGMAVATAALSVSLNVGDRLAQEFRSLGANLVVTPEADSLPLEIAGVDYRPANSGAYLPASDLPRLKTIFWHNNIIAFAPVLDASGYLAGKESELAAHQGTAVPLIGTWAAQPVYLPSSGETFTTGIEKTNPWFHIEGRWFAAGGGALGRAEFPGEPGKGFAHSNVRAPVECVVGAHLAERLGLRIGDRPYLNVSRAEETASSFPCTITGILSTGGQEENALLLPLRVVQDDTGKPGQYRKLYVSALTKPEDSFARRDPRSMNKDELERWSCSPYVSSIAYSIAQALPGSDVRVIRRVAEGEGSILRHVGTLLWLVTLAALLAAALAVGASSAASVMERRSEIALMKALGAGRGSVGFLLAAEQLLLAVVGGGIGYALGIFWARVVGQKIFGVAPEPSLLVFVMILALAAGVTMLGSVIPLRRAAHFEPAPILRGE
jgi:putative ABC transport system permease protein